MIVDSLGRGIHPDAYSERFRALRSSAGVLAIRLHEVRHTLASILHRGGVAPVDATALLGHTVTHVQFYLEPTDDGVTSAGVRLGELMAGTG